MKIYLVGGAVRDMLMGRGPKDRDYVVVGSTHEEMIALGFGMPVGASFPVYLHPVTGDEYALARTERSTGPGYHDFEVVFSPEVTIEEDLKRRDLTINAMAYDEEAKELIDPFGGAKDIENRILRAVSGTSMIEDPLRVYRAARLFARFGDKWDFDMDTAVAMLDAVDNLKWLPKERKFAEIQKCFSDQSESNRPSQMIDVLVELGELPEIDALRHVPQPPEHHPEGDAYTHTLLVMDAAKEMFSKPETMWAAMLHDVGKAVTYEAHGNLHGHEEAGVPVAAEICDRFGVPQSWKKLALAVTKNHGRIHRVMEMKPKSVYDLFAELKVEQSLDMLINVIAASVYDSNGRGPTRSKAYPQGLFLMRVALHFTAPSMRKDMREESQKIALKWKGNPAMISSEIRAMRISKLRSIIRTVKETDIGL